MTDYMFRINTSLENTVNELRRLNTNIERMMVLVLGDKDAS